MTAAVDSKQDVKLDGTMADMTRSDSRDHVNQHTVDSKR
jgi:hypothetical protein